MGAKKVTWRSEISETPPHFTDIDNDEPMLIESLAGLRPNQFDMPELAKQKALKKERYEEKGYCSAAAGEDSSLQPREQTLSVNASIQAAGDEGQHLPWMVDIDPPKSTKTY